MGPTSPLVLLAVLFAAGGLLVAVARAGLPAVKIASGVAVIALGMSGGLIAVNDYYGYYQNWGDALRDLSGAAAAPDAFLAHSGKTGRTAIETGSVQAVDLPGARSGIDRQGFVYLPPQYDNPAYRTTRFPMVELLHGSPGGPADWLTVLHVTRLVDRLIATHQMGPVILVMPNTNGTKDIFECLNLPGVQDETYAAVDVPADVRARFRVAADPAEHGLLGYSSGGYCAANLGLRHRGSFGAVASLDGYYQAQGEPAGSNLRSRPDLIGPNSPIQTAGSLPASTYPLPAFWVTAGTGNTDDVRQATAFVAALNRLEAVHFVVVKGSAHNFYAWNSELPAAIAWMWQQLASPDLRVRFPIAGTGTREVLLAPAPTGPPPVVRGPAPSTTAGARPRQPAPLGSVRTRLGAPSRR